jgi:serine/threonine protein kinase
MHRRGSVTLIDPMVTPLVQLSAGSLFAGDFRVVRGLDEGGMGAVYVVEQVSTGKQRALKVMHPQLVHDEMMRQRFVQEARIGAKIESEHVVDVIAAGIDASTQMPWLAMELLQGETLGERVDTMGPRHVAEAREVVSQLGHALAAAHRVGIVHRDLKPENVFLARPRREGVPFVVKVLDFGIAKLMAEADVRDTAAIGSPLWMAPEQAEVGGQIRACTDVWPLGLLAFFMLTGREFWRSANLETPSPVTVLTEMKIDPIPPASKRAAEYGVDRLLPAGFDAWFERCVNRDLDARFADGGAARRAFEEMVGPKGATKAPSAAGQRAAKPQEIPDLDIGPRTTSGFRPAVTLEDTGPAPASKPGLPELELRPSSASNPRMGAVSSGTSNPRMGAVSTGTSNPRMGAVSTGTSNPRMGAVTPPTITEIDDDDDPFERLGGGAPSSQPNPPRAASVSSPRVPMSTTTSGTSSPRMAAVTPPGAGSVSSSGRHLASNARPMLDQPESRIPGWLKWTALALVALGGIWFGLRTILRATERTRTEADQPNAGAAVPATPPLVCPKGSLMIAGGTLETSSGKVEVEAFCMDKTEVTVKAYLACVSEKKCTAAYAEGNWPASNAEQEAIYDKSCNGDKVEKINHPVNCVDAKQAEEYCAAHDMQLPTEVQWEWAARGRSEKWAYAWGKDAPDNQLCWSAFGARGGTCPVGDHYKGDTPQGIQDLDGNVREWLGGVPGEKAREYCGSDWTDTRQTLHALGYCSTAATTARSGFLGFRCVKS